MIIGTHLLLYSSDPEADRAFLADVLGFNHVDTGDGWLIFALPPAEAGVHPKEGPNMPPAARGAAGHGGSAAGAGEGGGHVGEATPRAEPPFMVATVWLMCEDVVQAVRLLKERGVDCPEPENEGWGIATSFALPGGERLGLYQPLHPVAFDL